MAASRLAAVGSDQFCIVRRFVALLKQPLLWLAIMLAIFFYKEVFLGLRFSPADDLFVAQPWHAVKPPSFLAPSNDLRADETLIGYPHRVDISTDIKRYGLPLWQEHTLVGSANTFSLHSLGAFAYPPFFSFLVFDPETANTILHVSIPGYAGLAMYLLLGRMTRRGLPRLLGALAFALNGYSIVWLSAFPLPAIVASLPLAIYLAWRFLEDSAWLLGALFSAVLAGVLIFSYPPGAVILLTLVAVFVLCWWAQRPRLRTGATLRLGVLGMLGLGVGMVAVWPTIEELSNYTSKQFRGQITGGVPVRFLAHYVFPNIAGNPIAHDWRAIGNYCEYVAYDGSLPLILALGGGGLLLYRRLRANPLPLAALFVGGVSLALVYAGPLIRIVDAHPPFNNINPPRWDFGVVFAIPVLAAYSLDELLSRGRSRAAVWTVAAGAAAVLAAAALLLAIKHHEFLHVDNFITQDYRLRLALLLVGALALTWVVRGPRPDVGAVAALAVVFVDLFTFGVDFNPAIPPGQMYPPTPALRYLQAHVGDYRVLPTNGVFTADDFNVYGIDIITGYDHFRDSGYVALIGDNMSDRDRAFWASTGYFTLGDSLHLDDQVFNSLSVKYAYFADTRRAAPALSATHWQQVYSGPDGLIFENLNVLPRQFVISDGHSAASPIVHNRLRPDQDQLDVAGPGLLVWSKPYTKDWKITVNGRPIEPEPYQGYFLSIRLSGATNNVRLSYEPSAYITGAAISAGSLVVVTGLTATGLVRNRRRTSALRRLEQTRA